MFFIIKNRKAFLAALKRNTKKTGILVIDDGDQSPSVTKRKTLDSGAWGNFEETADHLKCASTPDAWWISALEIADCPGSPSGPDLFRG